MEWGKDAPNIATRTGQNSFRTRRGSDSPPITLGSRGSGQPANTPRSNTRVHQSAGSRPQRNPGTMATRPLRHRNVSAQTTLFHIWHHSPSQDIKGHAAGPEWPGLAAQVCVPLARSAVGNQRDGRLACASRDADDNLDPITAGHDGHQAAASSRHNPSDTSRRWWATSAWHHGQHQALREGKHLAYYDSRT
jgi:hypothetical protein